MHVSNHMFQSSQSKGEATGGELFSWKQRTTREVSDSDSMPTTSIYASQAHACILKVQYRPWMLEKLRTFAFPLEKRRHAVHALMQLDNRRS